MRFAVVFGWFVVATIVIVQSVRGAMVELTVTITSIDVGAREITVTYETRAWQKTIQLIVGPKAKIMVNGKPGTLDSLKPEQKATVSFDKELLVANRIEAVTSESLERERRRFRMQEVSELNPEALPGYRKTE